MRGFGRGTGWGQGGGRGACGSRGGGMGWGGTLAQAPGGYSYVGGCRCGFGPNAYYQDTQGRVLPASALYSAPFGQVQAAQAPDEIERLRAEKSDLERRLSDLEARLKGTQ